MRRLRAWVVRLGAVFSRERRDRELTAELEGHLRMQIDDNLRAGMAPEEARRQALIKLGGVEQTKENYRDRRGVPVLETLFQDSRYALRMLRKNPGFTAAAGLTLALGIGANAAIFTLTYAVILKSLPVPNPRQLVRYTFREPGVTDLSLSGPAYDALRRHQTVDTDLLAWSQEQFAIEEKGSVSRVDGALISGNGFRVLELHPFLGRVFGDRDDVTGGGPNGYQALLGYDYWKQHFHESRSALGQSLSVNGRAVTVIGVLPPGFDGLIAGMRTDLVMPLAFEEVIHAPNPMRHHAGSFWLTVMGRLKPGESVQAARANLRATEATVREEADPTHHFLSGFFAPFRMGVESGRSGRSFLKVDFQQPLVALEVLVGLLLLLCCANTALLVLARVSSRTREFALRSALGASRARLFRQVLLEVGLLAGGGLLGGTWFGWAAARSLVSMLASIGQPPPIDVTPRAAIIAFTAAISVFSALAAGLWPALRAVRVAPGPVLKQGGPVSSAKGLGRWIVPAQVAVSVTLLFAASLLCRSFLRLRLENAGFRTAGVTMADVDLSAAKPSRKQAGRDALQMVEALENAPGVEAATVLSAPPIHDGWAAGHYFSLGKQGAVHSDMHTWPESVSPGYFATMGTRILEGRGLARADQDTGRACVLSASAAAYFFPGEDALGRFVYSGGEDPSKDGKDLDPGNACRVVGVSEDARFLSLREASPRMLYSLAEGDEWGTNVSLAVRSRTAGLAAAAIRDAVRRVTAAAATPAIFSFNDLVKQHLRQERMLVGLSACFAAIALLLTALGLYALLARDVLMRTREIGVRLALGARPGDALGMVIWQGFRLVLAGTAVGLAAALAVAKLLGSLLFGVGPADPVTLAAVVAVLLAVAFAASYVPGRRATRVDPMVALRYE
ncbi:MAG TPA: ADOP family duplicated permease [Terriglobia bacterium]|nr:ADOP family duplicated permease [Terriglobia bacterium]